MRSIGFMLADARYLEEAVLRISCPLFFKAKSPFIVEQNFGFLLPSRGVAGLWPYVFETLKDPKGMLLDVSYRIRESSCLIHSSITRIRVKLV